LAFALGRSDDALRIGLQIQSQRERLLYLVKSTDKPRKVGFQILHPTDRRDVLFIRGWGISGRSPLRFDYLTLKQYRYDVFASERYKRPDIKAHFGLDTDTDLGFNLLANNPKKSSDVMDRLRGKSCTMPVTGQTDIHEIRVPVDANGAAGHIDYLSWYRYFEMKDIDENRDYFIEVETSAPSHIAIMWSSSVIEFGERLSDTRVGFLKSTAAKLVVSPILIIPSDLRCDITVS
jgi:hypothetical protein